MFTVYGALAAMGARYSGAAVMARVLKLQTLKGIDRPAIACLLPTQNKVFVLIEGEQTRTQTRKIWFSLQLWAPFF